MNKPPERKACTVDQTLFTASNLLRQHADYELLEPIGRGPYSRVYRGRNKNTDQKVAVKELTDEARADRYHTRRLQLAIEFLANLGSYDHVIHPYSYIRDNDWLVSELMQGSLANRLAPGTVLPVERARSVLRQALTGLQTLHQAGRLHGRIKPSNLLFDDQLRVKVADSPGLVVDGAISPPVGQPKYIAPELVDASFGVIGPGVDIYALGLTILEVFIGEGFDDRFRGPGEETARRHVDWITLHSSRSAVVPSAASLIPELPADLARVIDRMLCKDVGDRYPTAAAVLADVRGDRVIAPVTEAPPTVVPTAAGGQPAGPPPASTKCDGLDVDLADNPDPRCPCVLLLDTSKSMAGERIAELSRGMRVLYEELLKERLARQRVEIAVVTFGGSVTVVQDFVTVDSFEPPVLEADGATPMGAAILTALALVAARKEQYQASGIGHYRPWIFLITDGAPKGEAVELIRQAARRVRAQEAAKKIAFFSVGVEGANMKLLAKLSQRPPVRLRGLDFAPMFMWLSRSQARVAQSQIGDQVTFPTIDWGSL